MTFIDIVQCFGVGLTVHFLMDAALVVALLVGPSWAVAKLKTRNREG